MTIYDFMSDNYVMIYELGGLVILLFVSAHISTSMKRKTLIAIGLLFIEDHKVFNFRFVDFLYFCQFCFVYAEAML